MQSEITRNTLMECHSLKELDAMILKLYKTGNTHITPYQLSSLLPVKNKNSIDWSKFQNDEGFIPTKDIYSML